MKEYLITKASSPIDWEKVPTLPIDNVLWLPEAPIRAEAKLCYDDEGFYVLMKAVEPHIRAEYTGLLDMPCEDSCLEFFFSPIPGDSRYFNIEVNPNACIYLGFGSNRYDSVRLVPNDSFLSPKTMRTDDGWQVTYHLPFSFVRRFFPNFAPKSGNTIRANFYKCGDLTVQEHYYAAFPVLLEQPDFHRPDFFGTLRFE